MQSVFHFLDQLKHNNNREWFAENKELYLVAKNTAKAFFEQLGNELNKTDDVYFQKMFRIYRDVRFSKDKSPYKTNFGSDFIRKQPYNRGSFYVHLEPGNTLIAGGFWNPNKEDVFRIRKAIELEDDLEQIIDEAQTQGFHFGHAFGDPPLKTAPKGFDKKHPRIKLICHKQFLFAKNIDEKTAHLPGFTEQIVDNYRKLLPFFRYMTEVLTTNENGESIIDQ